MITICFHGAESTGKSVLAAELARELDCPWVPEYGRTYCEARGTDLLMPDLLAIAEGQALAIALAQASQPPLVIVDTDHLMTAAWAQMLFGEVPDALLAYPAAELYLLFTPDVPWIDDGTRFFGKGPLRSRFAMLAEDMLVRTGAPFQTITGDWAERKAAALAAVTARLSDSRPPVSS